MFKHKGSITQTPKKRRPLPTYLQPHTTQYNTRSPLEEEISGQAKDLTETRNTETDTVIMKQINISLQHIQGIIKKLPNGKLGPDKITKKKTLKSPQENNNTNLLHFQNMHPDILFLNNIESSKNLSRPKS